MKQTESSLEKDCKEKIMPNISQGAGGINFGGVCTEKETKYIQYTPDISRGSGSVGFGGVCINKKINYVKYR